MSAPTIACIGGAHLDRRGILHAPVVLGTSNPGTVFADFGGVARNVAMNLEHLECRVLLCSRVGNDEPGRQVLSQPIDTTLVSVSDRRPTATYTAVLEPGGELVLGLADMDVYEEITRAVLMPVLPCLRNAALWFIDANLPAETIEWLLGAAGEIPIAVDAVSVAKSRRLSALIPAIRYLFCNLAQASALLGTPVSEPTEASECLRRAGSGSGVVSAGADGIAIYDATAIKTMSAFPAKLRDVTGAGDALVAGTLYGVAMHLDLFAAARLGLAAAAITVESENSTSPHLSPEALYARA
ncbi:MAG TPA: carbohydrate kinase family protein [Bryobacteraceae bacterium]